KGTVIGRWRFPGDIDAVIVTGDGSVDVRVKTTPWHANRTLTVHFNPAAPQVPRWDTGALLPFRTAEAEALSIVRAEVPLEDWPAAAPAAIATLPRFDDRIARDPSAPLF